MTDTQVTHELLRTPLEAAHESAGAKLVPFAGWRMPLQYAGIVAEHNAVRTSAGVFDVSHMGQLRIHGRAAIDAVQRVLSNDLARMEDDGAAQYSMLLNERGGIEDDLIAYRISANELLLVVNAANREHDVAFLRAQIGEGADDALVDETMHWGMLALQGPFALDVLADLGLDLRGTPAFRLVSGTLNDDITVHAATTGYTGERGCELLVTAADAALLWDLLLGDPRVSPVGLGARDTLRLEACYPLHGNDIDSTTDPIGAGLGFAAPRGIDDSPAHNSVDQIRDAGPGRKLVPLQVEGRGIPRSSCAVLDAGGTEIGRVTSGTMSPILRTGIALAWIDAASAAIDTPVSIDIRGTAAAAVVVKRPFVRGSL